MQKTKRIITNSSNELANALGLTSSDALEIEIRSALNHKIVEIVTKKKLTHAQVATLAKTSRTRITAIMNYNIKGCFSGLNA